jgi:hypothetical protein
MAGYNYFFPGYKLKTMDYKFIFPAMLKLIAILS